jgi:hypothetical protein
MLTTAKTYVTTVLCLQHTIFIETYMLHGGLQVLLTFVDASKIMEHARRVGV